MDKNPLGQPDEASVPVERPHRDPREDPDRTPFTHAIDDPSVAETKRRILALIASRYRPGERRGDI